MHAAYRLNALVSSPRKLAAVTVISALALTTGTAQAAGRVEVQFISPENYADAGRYAYDRDRTVDALGRYVQLLGNSLPDGQTLKLEVLDIDLAGTLEPVRGGELRIVRGQADWPQIRLRYALQAGGTALKSGEARLWDPSYLQTYNHAANRDGEFAYEKRMLRQWFRQTVLAP